MARCHRPHRNDRREASPLNSRRTPYTSLINTHLKSPATPVLQVTPRSLLSPQLSRANLTRNPDPPIREGGVLLPPSIQPASQPAIQSIQLSNSTLRIIDRHPPFVQGRPVQIHEGAVRILLRTHKSDRAREGRKEGSREKKKSQQARGRGGDFRYRCDTRHKVNFIRFPFLLPTTFLP